MDKTLTTRLLILSSIFVIISPLGVYKLGGIYWVLYLPVAFLSLIISGRKPNIHLLNNIGFFAITTFTFLLFRFVAQLTERIGLKEGGLFWFFFVISFLQGFFTQISWGVFRNLFSPTIGFKPGTRRSIILTYGLIIFAPQAFLWFLTNPTGSYVNHVWTDFIVHNFPCFSLIFYGLFVAVFIITLGRHTRESIFYSHDINGEVVRLNKILRKYFVYPILLTLALITEYFYRGKDYPLLLTVLFPLCLFYMYFNYLTGISYQYQGQKPELKEIVGEPGPIAIVLIGIVVIAIVGFFAFLEGFSSP